MCDARARKDNIENCDGGERTLTIHVGLTPKHPLCANDASRWIYRAVDDIHGHNMGTMGIGVFVPHPNDDMRPRVTTERWGRKA
jgi:hypothetical protein